MKMKEKLLGAVAFCAMFAALPASAQQNMNVTATVPEVCVITTPGTDLNMAFDLSALDTAIADFTATADFRWRCSLGNAAVIEINSGSGSGANANLRYMIGPGGAGADELGYVLTVGGVTVGDDSNGATGLAVVGAGMGAANEQTTTIDGTVALADAQAATAGAYTDTVVITLLP